MSNTRIAQIGVGHWGKNLARNYAQLGALAAVADYHAPTAERIAQEHGTQARSFEDILADDSIHGVSLATPAETHADVAIAALEAGKHVYVEKPLALLPADGERMAAKAEEVGKILMVGHLLQYHPIFRKAKELVAGGAIGQLRYVYSNRLSLGKFRTEENVMWSFAPHDFSMLLAMVGEAPDAVTAEGAAWITPGIADWCTAHLQFPGGVRGHVQTSWSHPFKEARLVAVGDEGMLVFEDSAPEWDRKLAIYRHGIDRSGPAPAPIKADPEYIAVEQGEPLRSECQHFIDCIEQGTQPLTDVAEGLRVLEVLDRAEAALQASLGEKK